jgi:hypothetical protein
MESLTYEQYCLRRGYAPPFKGWPVIRRSLFESWMQPGFHRFWRVWNPPVGYLLCQIYIRLGGNRNRLISTSVVFLFSGALHDLVVIAFAQRWGPIITFSYVMFGWISLLSLKMENILHQEKWPSIYNVILNVGFIVIVFETIRRLYWHLVTLTAA